MFISSLSLGSLHFFRKLYIIMLSSSKLSYSQDTRYQSISIFILWFCYYSIYLLFLLI